VNLEEWYFSWWRLVATEEEKYGEWTEFVDDTGSTMTYSIFCDALDSLAADRRANV
jgi:hypothetical protein